jgi:Sulfotransferase family
MAVHFVHVRKTGGLAVKQALLDARLAAFAGEEPRRLPKTPYGRIVLHRRHNFRVRDVPEGDHVFFFVRDPAARFVSGFYSRKRKGQPRHHVEWSAAERQAFETFPTPQRLAAALSSADEKERRRARRAMRKLRHLQPMWRSVGRARGLRRRADQILFVGRQETIEDDWERLKTILELPPDLGLPSDPVLAHRNDPALDTSLDALALDNLRRWYRRDYRLLAHCDRLRAERGWDGRR